MIDSDYMRMALEYAAKVGRSVRPNPNVGCVIVHNDRVIGSGYHMVYGQAHAEVNAINSVKDKTLLRDSTLYVTLEPCSHWGKTPPCTQLIIDSHIPRVVVGISDPYKEVSGRGISQLREAGIDVSVGILEDECREINCDFITYHSQHRPHIILKWAQTCDGFLDNDRDSSTPAPWITGERCRKIVHQWRSECDAILVGVNTIERDNPELTVREVVGRNPLRVVVDKNLRTTLDRKIFNDKADTLIITSAKNYASATSKHPTKQVETIDFEGQVLSQICDVLYKHGIMSLFIEGGAYVLNQFIDNSLWDQARIFTSTISVDQLPGGRSTQQRGVLAPKVDSNRSNILSNTYYIDDIKLDIKRRL